MRAACLTLGGSILLAVLSSKAYYGNNKTFCGLALFLAGLYEPGQEPWLLRWQLALVYLGAGLNKLMDADWRSGQFFEHWAVTRLRQSLYLAADALLPPMLLAKFMCWTTILTELGLSLGFLVRRAWYWAVWVGVLFQAALMLFTGTTFTMFFYAMEAALLVFVDWPAAPATVIYDGDCGLCALTRRWFERFDLERAFDWRTYQSGAGEAFGIPVEALRRRLHLAVRGRIYTGFRAFQMMLLYNPVTYLAMAALLAAAPPDAANYRRAAAGVLLLFFSPLAVPLGDVVYDLVARNRHRLPVGEKRCQMD
ncbi:MAG TPA: DUF393 domain-containing protein [Bryobacteraceae bacterium]|nr:DUF393 domain-containing protein [Bryobacteraceae bacterium]